LSTARLVTSVVAGVVLLIVAVSAIVARYVPIPGHRTLYVVIASPFLAVGAPLALLVLLWGHRWVMAGAAAYVSLAVALIGTAVVKHRHQRLHDDDEVPDHRPVVDVRQVQPDGFVP
jgi:hypothetical protein